MGATEAALGKPTSTQVVAVDSVGVDEVVL
jgi:hypothetical protein